MHVRAGHYTLHRRGHRLSFLIPPDKHRRAARQTGGFSFPCLRGSGCFYSHTLPSLRFRPSSFFYLPPFIALRLLCTIIHRGTWIRNSRHRNRRISEGSSLCLSEIKAQSSPPCLKAKDRKHASSNHLRSHHLFGATGRLKVNFRPPVSAFSTDISPCIAIITRRTRGSPRPEPPFLRERPLSTL